MIISCTVYMATTCYQWPQYLIVALQRLRVRTHAWMAGHAWMAVCAFNESVNVVYCH